MSRNLLHKSKLSVFIVWLDTQGIAHRPPRGEYQVLQINLRDSIWCCIFDRDVAPEHYTNDRRLDSLIRRFIRDARPRHAIYIGPDVGWNITSGMGALIMLSDKPGIILAQFDDHHASRNGVDQSHGWHEYPAVHFQYD